MKYPLILSIGMIMLSAFAYAVPALPKAPPLPKAPTEETRAAAVDSTQAVADSQAWVLNASQDDDRQSVQQWVARLQKAGFAAYTVMTGRDRAKVVIGPSLSQKQLLQQQTVLSKQYHFATTIANYQPLSGDIAP